MADTELPAPDAAYPPSAQPHHQPLYPPPQGPHPTSDPPPSQPQAHYSPSDAPPSYESQVQQPPPYPQHAVDKNVAVVHQEPPRFPQQQGSWRPENEMLPHQRANWRPVTTSRVPVHTQHQRPEMSSHQQGSFRPVTTSRVLVRTQQQQGWTIGSGSLFFGSFSAGFLIFCLWSLPCSIFGIIFGAMSRSQETQGEERAAKKLGAYSILCTTLSWIAALAGVGALVGVGLMYAPPGGSGCFTNEFGRQICG